MMRQSNASSLKERSGWYTRGLAAIQRNLARQQKWAELRKFKKGKWKVLHLRKNNSMHQYMLEASQLRELGLLVWRRDGSKGDLINFYRYLKEERKMNRAWFFFTCSSAITRGNRHALEYRRPLWIVFVLCRWQLSNTGCPERLWGVLLGDLQKLPRLPFLGGSDILEHGQDILQRISVNLSHSTVL